ncbi:MAG: VCBS repeat-containing protein, partial [Flavisolibacter sp.]|nr:VCBS repeat-containing protein [Flavisolibacter sp.]
SLDDLFIGASASYTGVFLLQQPNGTFIQKELPPATGRDVRKPEMMGVLLFDADGDGDLDLYTCSGSNEFKANTRNYQDQLYVNTGRGNFAYDSAALPLNFTSKSCVKAADFDGDGDLDLFIGGRVHPERYPEPVSSFIYRNDSKDGKIKFTDVTAEVAPFLKDIGLVCDAVWSDYDNDGWVDLVLAGEWMPITILKNNKGKFQHQTTNSRLQTLFGWWSSITAGDFDNDGDIDYVVGNLGLNSFFKASEQEPVKIYAADFDGDQAYDAIPTLYLPDKNGQRKEYPANVRDDMVKQMIGTRRKFPNYKSYADADVNLLLSKEEQQKALVLKANFFASCLLQNKGNGQFDVKPLPLPAQLAPLNGMVAEDVNGDGFLDLVINGNDFGNEVVNGRYDALNGLVLLGKGDGSFQPLNLQHSGFFIPGDGKGLAKLVINNQYSLAATQNRDKLQVFSLQHTPKIIRLRNDDVSAIIYLKNGHKRKEEVYYGSSFLSQSARFITLNDAVQQVEIVNTKGQKRMIKPQ